MTTGWIILWLLRETPVVEGPWAAALAVAGTFDLACIGLWLLNRTRSVK